MYSSRSNFCVNFLSVAKMPQLKQVILNVSGSPETESYHRSDSYYLIGGGSDETELEECDRL